MIPQHLLHNLNLSGIAVTAAIAADGTLKPVGEVFEKLFADPIRLRAGNFIFLDEALRADHGERWPQVTISHKRATYGP